MAFTVTAALSRLFVQGRVISELPTGFYSSCYNYSLCSESSNSTASIATQTETGQFSDLAPPRLATGHHGVR
jgi:hypothetical protein